ncbi:MAG: YgiQ family radical SAM protein [Methanocorpusculum sp.]|nr:YgiQ family radical SAM protein [Methanocorpusculum sp.]HJJ45314.1 YgiQ family radical SAM protein [Methanocorpusculum sp.]
MEQEKQKILRQPKYLPISAAEAKQAGFEQPDVVLVSADAYVDHPSFAAALLGRVLVDAGFTVGIISQPDWRDRSGKDFTEFGAPKLFFAVVPGAVDSMINAYTPALRKRRDDQYSPGGRLTRPERTTIVYTNILHRLYPEIPIIIGGVEASLRRFAHYDYWSDSVRQGILADTPASLLVCGQGEKPLIEAAKRRRAGKSLRGIKGTCHTVSVAEFKRGEVSGTVLPSYTEVKDKENKGKFAEYWKLFSEGGGDGDGVLIQPHPKTVIVQNREAEPLTTGELDRIYELPYTRRQHPSIKETVPALAPVQFSITTHRGCFGACSFCSITHHQGKHIVSRSEASIIREAERMAKMPEFKGTISDVGGPSANMYGYFCKTWETKGPCRNKSCIGCPSLKPAVQRQSALLEALRNIPRVKHVFISSGIRYDLIPEDADGDEYLKTVAAHHISGHLKVAPEHIVPRVTQMMNKPDGTAFDAFRKRFEALQQKKTDEGRKRQYLVPYLMSSHPGCRIEDMVTLALYLREHHLYTEQVQDFTPSPMTLSTAMYYTGIDPRTDKSVHVPLGNEKLIQRAILQWRDPKQYDFVVSGLLKAGRRDLIGNLVPDRGIPDRDVTHRKERRRG